ncbi:hypothetical protein GCM10027280_05120 [Micromonospora polyrhachis]|uniref:PknH-like extracellular domain-containing protein n=1 Tax=Micromonospora polyrhachis TaxID=1282883 RepID=A0A7W7SLU7_9ACTN|nr:hypothetical protein [Micromonospora polyrhachis]MBB4956577.1 hypothetical protein [Micromonospora polyrhachis]
MTRRIHFVVVAAAVLAGLAGCQTTAGRQPGRVASPAGPGTLFSPSPAPSGYTYSGPAEGMERRTIAPDGLLGLGLRVGEDSAGSDRLSPCGDPEPLFEWLGLGYLREWESGQDTPAWTYVKQYTMPFFRDEQVIPGNQVVAEVKRRTTCRTYDSREGTPRLTGELVLPALPGVDAQWAFCERIARSADRAYQACTVYLARAEIVSKVRVRTSEQADARELLPQVAAVAAKALAGR